ncbi:MAG: tetratricopeptide repeat protein, partial [Methanobacteriota archaeon]
MEEILQQIKEFQGQNNWHAIIQLLKPICQPDQWGWQEPELMSALGFAYSQVGDLEAAKHCYQRWIEIEPDRAQPYYCLGYIFYLEKDWQEAIRWFEQALEFYPDYLVCLYRLGYAYYEFNKARESIPILEKVKDLYTQASDEDWQRRNRKNYLKSLFLLARCYYNRKQYDEALSTMEQLMREDRKNVVEMSFKNYAMGKILAARKEYDRALSYLGKALNPRHPQPYVLDQMGRVYHEQQDYQKALEHYERALKIRRFPYILINRADTLLAMGRTYQAIRDLHDALKRDNKGKHKIYLKLGYINLKLKKLNEAKHYFESAIEWKQ